MMANNNEEDQDNNNAFGEITNHTEAIEAGLFGVFFTISREKRTSAPKWAIITIVLDFLQLIAFSVNPSFGWAPEIDQMWTYLKYFTFKNPLVSFGFTGFAIGYALLASILVVSLCICGMVGYHFKTNSFPWIWPVKFVRFLFSVFIGVFYISTLHIFLLSVSCRGVTQSDGTTKIMMKDFTDRECWTAPHLFLAVFGILFSILLAVTALGVALTSFEPNLNTKDLLAQSVGRRRMQEYMYKTMLSVTSAVLWG